MTTKVSAKQSEALRSASLLTGVVPSWVHARCGQALVRKGLATPYGLSGRMQRFLLTPEGRKLQEELLEAEGDPRE